MSEAEWVDYASECFQQAEDLRNISLLNKDWEQLKNNGFIWRDFLGECFEELGASNSKTGQFFTPYSVAQMCGRVMFNKEQIDAAIAEKGYVGINEPAAGGGAMIVSFLEAMKENGYNFQTQSLTVAQDIDYRCAYMCYVTLSLLGAPAIVCIGDTLTLDIWEELHTPFYVLNYWKFKRHGKNPVADEPTAAENDPTDVERVKVEVVKRPTVQKIPNQLSLF